MTFGVTPTGFNRKTNEDLKNDGETYWKNNFGQDSDLSEDSPNSILIGLTVAAADELWQVAENIYNSTNVNVAEGVDLDNASSLVGVERKGASASTATVSFRGDNATLIPIDTQVKQSSTGIILKTLYSDFLSQSNTNWIQVSITTVSDNATYKLYIDSNVYSYVADGTATEDEIVAGLKAIVESSAIGLSVTDGGGGLMLIESDDKNDIYDISADSKITIGKVQSVIEVQALDIGKNEIAPSTIDEISTALSGLDSVRNYFAGESGREIETDQELRIRRVQNIAVSGFNFVDAIRAKILDDVVGVSYCKVYENDTLVIDVDGIEPKSYETVVEGGSNTDIAEKLSTLKTGGIPSSGDITVEVTNAQGTPQNIKFTRPINNYLWVDVVIDSYNDEEEFPIAGEAAIKDALLEFSNTYFNIGDIIVTQKLYTPVFSVSGIGSVTITIAATGLPSGTPIYSPSNVNLSIREKPNFDLDRMTVSL